MSPPPNPPTSPPIVVTRHDHDRLTALLDDAGPDDVDGALANELARATIVAPEEVPADVVTMNSRVSFVDEETGKVTSLQLVYPWDADPSVGRVSVFAALGAALIGLSRGQSITWRLPNGRTRTVRIVSVDWQPEAAGDWRS